MTGNTKPTLNELFAVFLKIGLLSFGGPAAQIALMHKMITEEKKWLDEKQFLNALSFCMLLPGPEAMQLATYVGWRLKGLVGGLIGGLLFVIPGAIVILILATIYAYWGDVPLVSALFLGIKATVLIVVIEALLRVSKRALKSPIYWWSALVSFIGIFFFDLSYPLIVLAAAILGFFLNSAPSEQQTNVITVSFLSSLKSLFIWLAIWILPILLLVQFSEIPILTDISLFFSKLAVVTFGGAYAVLAYMGQDVVSQYGWLSAGEMMDGLGLAETTPGPLILVTEFVGFLAAFREGGVWLGVAGAIVTLWVTFVPCFLWIFIGAPYIDWICAQPRLNGALSAITAAVVGVILNLSIWFGLHVLFSEVSVLQYGLLKFSMPDILTLDWRVTILVVISGLMLLKYHINIVTVLVISAILGVLLTQI